MYILLLMKTVLKATCLQTTFLLVKVGYVHHRALLSPWLLTYNKKDAIVYSLSLLTVTMSHIHIDSFGLGWLSCNGHPPQSVLLSSGLSGPPNPPCGPFMQILPGEPWQCPRILQVGMQIRLQCDLAMGANCL